MALRHLSANVVGAFVALAASVQMFAAPQIFAPTKPPTTDPKDASPWPDAATLADRKRAAEAKPLFNATSTLVFSLVADFEQVQLDRDPEGTKTYPAKIIVADKNAETTIPVHVRTRGHSRLKPDLCRFAPLRIEFDVNPVGTIFEGQRKLKLGVHCRDSGEYPEYVVREYPIYRMYNILTPRSFRARLAEAHYIDARSNKTLTVRSALWIEDDDDVARRMEGRISETSHLSFGRMDSLQTTLMAFFEYMIGNTDVSIIGLHNVRMVLTKNGSRYPVPYDFDFAGIVDADYALPSPLVPVASVRERYYMGPCQVPDVLDVFVQRFKKARPQFEALYDSIPELKPKYVKQAKEYLDEFFKTIERPEGVKKAFVNGCKGRPYM